MRMRRQAGALILYGGWLLLSNPEANRPDAPLSSLPFEALSPGSQALEKILARYR